MNKMMRAKMAPKRLRVRKRGIMGAMKRREPTRFMIGLTSALFAENLHSINNAPDTIVVELGRGWLELTGNQDSGTRVANGSTPAS